jgi:pimeloyl-ACP methyl ester carboxylesterase
LPEPLVPPALIAGSGPPVVLLHAFPLDGRMWAPQVEALSGSFQVIVPDLRGFGAARGAVADPDEHDLGEGGWMDLLADDVALLLDRLEVERAVVAGLSLGGYLAFALWRRHAARIRALGLIATRAGKDREEAARNRLEMAERVGEEGVAFVPTVMLPRILGATSRATRPEVIERVTRLIIEQSPAGVAAAQRGMATRADSTGTLGSIDVPVLVIAGAEDETIPVGDAKLIADQVRNGRLVEIESAGHLVNLEQAELLNQLVYQFVSELGQSTQ